MPSMGALKYGAVIYRRASIRYRWKGLKSIGMVESERTVNGKTSIERRHYLCTLKDVASFSYAARAHWGIENSLH